MGSSRSKLIVVFAALACRPGLPPEPPGADPADPAAPAGATATVPNPFERSAFEGETIDSSEHDHGAHAGHGETKKPDPPQDHHGGHRAAPR
jgi:hypothetical protein